MISGRPELPNGDMRLAFLLFENHLTTNRRTDKPVLYIALSPAPEDRLNNDRLVGLAEKYIRKMGYGNQPFIVYRHGDTCNTHVYIVSVYIDDEGRGINDPYERRRSTTVCWEPEQGLGLRSSADAKRRNPKAELKKVDASQGGICHQIGNTLKTVLESYRLQTFGRYSTLLFILDIETRQVRGGYMETPYTGIIYSATSDSGEVVSPPIKSTRFGKRFGDTGLSKRMLRYIQDFKGGRRAPAISGKVVWAVCNIEFEQESGEPLRQEHIGVVFRRSNTGRIYGATFVGHGRREAFNGSYTGREFPTDVFDDLACWWEGVPWQERQQSGPEGLWRRYGHCMGKGSTLEQAVGIFSFETDPAVDYEEGAFRHRVRQKKKSQKRKSHGI